MKNNNHPTESRKKGPMQLEEEAIIEKVKYAIEN
jgi:hypothetical protein